MNTQEFPRQSPTCSRVLGALVVATCTFIVVAQSHATVIRFDNPPGPGHFVWFGGISSDPIGLDMTLPAPAQSGAYGGMGQIHQSNSPPSRGDVAGGAGGGELHIGGSPPAFLAGLNDGAPIPSGLGWASSGLISHSSAPAQADILLPEGVPLYLGVRFPLDDGLHYGWIGVVRQNTFEVDAFAWGYETEPGVPIAAGAPEPGSLALLAFGTGALLRRRAG